MIGILFSIIQLLTALFEKPSYIGILISIWTIIIISIISSLVMIIIIVFPVYKSVCVISPLINRSNWSATFQLWTAVIKLPLLLVFLQWTIVDIPLCLWIY